MGLASLLFASSEVSADMLYFAGVLVPDAFIALEVEGLKIGVLSRLEIARVSRTSSLDKVLSLEDLKNEAKMLYSDVEHGDAHVIGVLAKRYGITEFVVPIGFPSRLAFDLVDLGLKIKPSREPLFFTQRLHKSTAEVECIRRGNFISASGIRAAEAALQCAKIENDNRLSLDGEILTSERLRSIIDIRCLELGGRALNTICAGGQQACDPHDVGSGPLYANETIIVDVFPGVSATGYHGDMTRTFVKGKATDEQRRLITTVREAQLKGMEGVCAGVESALSYTNVITHFEENGYQTECIDGVWHGFFHSLGHGLGLDIHEPPRLYMNGPVLQADMVVTVEPGLYYPGLGACRIEDVLWIQDSGFELLSDCHYEWEIE